MFHIFDLENYRDDSFAATPEQMFQILEEQMTRGDIFDFSERAYSENGLFESTTHYQSEQRYFGTARMIAVGGVSSVPIPSTFWLVGAGLYLWAWLIQRRRSSR